MERMISLWLKIFFVLLVLAGLLIFLVSIGDLVRLVLIAAVFSYLLDPAVTRIEAHGLSRTAATAILFIIIATVITVVLILVMPLISSEIRDISAGIDPTKARQFIDRIDQLVQNALGFLGVQGVDVSARLGQIVVDFSNALISRLSGIFTVITNLVIIPFVAFFLLKDGRDIKKHLISLVPNRYFELTCNMIYKMDQQLGQYLRGQLIDASIIGILSSLALLFLQVKYALLIGAFAGLANLVPYIGPLSGALLAITVCLFEGADLSLVLSVAGAFAVVQLIDNVVVQPAVVASRISMHPVVVLLVVIIGGQFFGVLGMLLSVPATAVLKVFIGDGYRIYRQYRLS